MDFVLYQHKPAPRGSGAENIPMTNHPNRKKSIAIKMLEAELYGNRALADANEAAEKGNKIKAEQLYVKGQYWLDRYNKLAGNS